VEVEDYLQDQEEEEEVEEEVEEEDLHHHEDYLTGTWRPHLGTQSRTPQRPTHLTLKGVLLTRI
jgi:hypothetical protein